MQSLLSLWPFWAILSAVFAAATAILGKVGVSGIDSNLATLIRTVVILLVIAAIVSASNAWPGLRGIGRRSLIFLVLSGIATGASWLCYYRALKLGPAAQVAPIDKLSVVMVGIFAVAFLGEKLSAANWLGIVLIAGGAILTAL